MEMEAVAVKTAVAVEALEMVVVTITMVALTVNTAATLRTVIRHWHPLHA
jgi:hypothetical protein